MKILVCISKSPDTTSKIAFTDNNTRFDETGVQYIVNPYDEWYALVRAIELKEQHGGEVTTITVGTPADDAIIRKALAIGADNAVRVNTEAQDAYSVAFQISEYAKNMAANRSTINRTFFSRSLSLFLYRSRCVLGGVFLNAGFLCAHFWSRNLCCPQKK